MKWLRLIFIIAMCNFWLVMVYAACVVSQTNDYIFWSLVAVVVTTVAMLGSEMRKEYRSHQKN